jgi:hypothetical protein
VQTQYNQKKQQAEQILEQSQFEQSHLLEDFCERLCAAPFIKKPDTITLWLELWPLFDEEQRRHLTGLPDPCLKHVESRMGKQKRADHLKIGIKRLIAEDQQLVLEGLRLYPHAVCRTAEAVGPLDAGKWGILVNGLQDHRLWQVRWELSEDEFWEAVELLEEPRELPQSVLDYLDYGRPREKAPLQEFLASLRNYLLRSRIEKIRLATYDMLRCHHPDRALKVGLNK